jgi:phytanoyl-CoA hydroxylase
MDRDRFRREGYVVAERAVERATCDTLVDHVSEMLERIAREHLSGERPTTEFWKTMPASLTRTCAFWDDARVDLATLPPTDWEARAMRLGHILHVDDEPFQALCTGPTIGGGLAALVGEPARLVQSAVIYKQPLSDAVQFGWHQDSSYLTADPDTLVLAFLALDDMDEENGCLHVAPRSHADGLHVRLALGSNGFVDVEGRGVKFAPVEDRPVTMRRGDVLFASGRTYHASGPNRSARPRRALIVHAMAERSRFAATSWVGAGEGLSVTLPSVSRASASPSSQEK